MFRIERFNNRAVDQIQLQFTEDLDPNIGINNIRVRSNVSNIADLEVKAVRILQSIITISTTPQRPLSLYFIEFLDTDEQRFISLNNGSLQNDTKFYFIGQERPNDIRDNILNRFPGVYDTDQETLVRQYIANLSEHLLRGRTDVRETGNANFLFEEVVDEPKTRGFGPTDRLFEEGAFEVMRVSTVPEGTSERGTFNFSENRPVILVGASNTDNVNLSASYFPSDPFSLRSVEVVKEIVSNAEILNNSFEGTTISLSRDNVAVVYSVVLVKPDGTRIYYDLPTYGYSLIDNRYDTIFGRRLLTLESNQVKLADLSIIEGDFESPTGADQLEVSYLYVDTGRNINGEVEVSQVRQVTRELISPILTVFSLKNFPIVLQNDTIPTVGGVQFLDPAPTSGTPFTKAHPAFITELPYDETRLPANPGEYSVNYNTAQVFVFGASTNDGTGQIPPVADYFYRKVYSQGVDYNFDTDSDEIVAVPGRDLIGSQVKVTYQFERILAEGIDYEAETHIEAINEYVENRLENQTKLVTQNFPITDVFEVYNETTGETYSITRFDDNYVYFTGITLPKIITRENEQVKFVSVTNETLFVTEEIDYSVTAKIMKIQLENNEVVTTSGQKRASNVNAEIFFNRPDLFAREFFYDSILQTVDFNLTKLSVIGDYLVNYKEGIVYLLADINQPLDVGGASYTHARIRTDFPQVLGVNEIGYRTNIKSDRVLEVQPESFTSTTIDIAALPDTVERFYQGDPDKPITFGTTQFGVAGQKTPGSFEFTAADGDFSIDFADGYHILRIPGDPDRGITAVTSTKTLIVDIGFTELDRNAKWCIIDFNLADGYEVVLTYNADFVRGVYTVTDLQTNDKDSLTNLWDPAVDTISGNRLIFNNPLMQATPAGTSLAVDYSFGNLWIDYTYIRDVLRVSYEHGDNSLNFSLNDSLDSEDEYFVTYRYGALRDKLLENFGSLTQVQDLTTFPLDFDRELYRDFLRGTLQGFVRGPTNPSIKTLVRSVTDIDPTITELTFNEWTAGRDNLHLQEGLLTGEERYDSGRFEDGLVIDGNTTLKFPGEAYISHREGTFQGWVTPAWDGIDNDADIFVDVGANPTNIFIGASGYNPSSVPFTLNRLDPEPNTSIGRPANYPTAAGHYVWFDDLTNKWNFASTLDGYGEITTTGQIYDVEDGYNITSTFSYIRFDGYGDGAPGAGDGYGGFEVREHFTWSADDVHYLFDTGPSLHHNRLSLFKDGSGYLNFRIYDDNGKRHPTRPRQYNLSYNIQDWIARESHFIAASWRLNSVEGIDEMHLFIDGQEVSNLFKYGGRPITTINDLFRTVADEYLTTSSPKTIVGGIDGSSNATATFTSFGSDFVNDGVVPGDTLTILDATADGVASPHSIIGVGPTSLVLSAPLLLTLDDIKFAVNQASYTVETNVDVEKFAVFVEDGYGERTELRGIEADDPDYSIEREAGINTIFINNGVSAGDAIVVNTLGLTKGRCRDIVFEYEDGYSLRSKGTPPASLDHFDAYKIFCRRASIELDGYKLGGSGFFTLDGYELDGYFTDICQPSNTVRGKTISVSLGGTTNIDFSGVNEVTINGTTFGGPTFETLTFLDYGPVSTTEFFTSIDSIDMTFTSFDPTISFGSVEVMEAQPFTKSEGGGDYAQVTGYDNGVFSFVIFGSGGLSFDIEGGCYYMMDYPMSLNIPMSQKGPLFIGSDIEGNNQWDGTLDQVLFLNEMLDDIRVGENKTGSRTITEDYNSPIPLTVTPQTLMLLNMDGDIDNVQEFYRTFDERFVTSSRSVNESFSDAIVFMNDEALVIDNGAATFNNNQGSVEFWVNPLVDTLYDENNQRYYIDLAAIRKETIPSDSALRITLPSRAKRVISIRLLTDDGTGTDFFEGGQLFVDGVTILLGTRLPSATTLVEVQYVPVDLNGDRFSIYKDGVGYINFSIIANEQLYLIRYPIDWRRNTWHRIVATWRTNSVDGIDRMRLFVDGVERGTILWGTPGLLWGSGVLYGSAAVGSPGSNALVANIDMEDTFADINIGNSFDNRHTAAAKMDNIRWSNTIREPSIVAGQAIDVNWNANVEAVSPVVEDNFTTALLDFDREVEVTEFLSNLFSKFTPLFQIDIDVDDSFRRMPDQRSRDIMERVLQRMKPSHAKMLVRYLQEL